MKYSPSDYVNILHKTKDVEEFITLLKNHWVLPWLPKILQRFEKLHERREGIVRIGITSAYPLTKEVKDQIEGIVKKEIEGKTLRFNVALDKTLLGGFRVESDEMLLPASIRDRIERLTVNLEI